MKVFTNDKNTATLKIIIASAISKKRVEIVKASFDAPIFSGPRQLPLLEVNEELSFFSSNAATLYILPDGEGCCNGQSQQLQEWEATRLHPTVASVLSTKSVSSDLKQMLQAQLQYLEGILQKNQYVIGYVLDFSVGTVTLEDVIGTEKMKIVRKDMWAWQSKLSAIDVIFWSTLFPLYYDEDLKNTYFNELKSVCRWYREVADSEAVQGAVQQWGGGSPGPFSLTSALGIPQNTNLGSPAGTPDDSKDERPTAEEMQLAKDNWLNGHKNVPKRHKLRKPVLPVAGRKNVLITSALPYVNNVPHLGNIIGCVLSADIFARYCRLCDYNTLFVCGTDEYGTATETKALEEGLTPRELCDKYHAIHRDAYAWFDIEFDYFGRTTTDQQTEISQKLFLKLMDNGFISSQAVDQLLCEKCQRFLADRFVEGTCPHPGCNFPEARGDQCDGCGKLVVATELREPRCKQCRARPVVRQSRQLFLELPRLESSLRTWMQSSWEQWSAAARGAARPWLREPLRARAVTRDLKWGVRVPTPGYTDKVFYVWFDAPIGYMSITQNATNDYEKWWKPEKDTDVALVQFMAKDNVPFHAVMFPATLLGVNEGHLLVKHIFATEYLNYEDGKFSKSRGVGVFADNCKESGISPDVWRYYLAATRPETNDYSFSWTELLTRNNSELLNNLGNFCHRSLSFCAAAFSGRVPDITLAENEYEFVALVNREYKAYVENMERGKLRESLRHVTVISRLGNQLMQAAQPWALLKGGPDDRARAAAVVGLCCNVVGLLARLLAPFAPAAAARLAAQLGLQADEMGISPGNPCLTQYLPAGHPLGSPAPLFSRLDPETIDRLRDKCSGGRGDKNNETPSVKELELSIAIKADKIRQLKAATRDPLAWRPLAEELHRLKKQLLEAQIKTGKSGAGVGEMEKEVALQADKVRQLKASTKDKSVWQPEVDKLLSLKKQLADAQRAQRAQREQPPAGHAASGAAELEKAVAEQADKVRQLKASTKDKSVWQPEVDKLLSLKKQLADAQRAQREQREQPPAGHAASGAAELEKAVAEQADKVRNLKASTKDKSVWQPEVNTLLELKKKLAGALAK